MIVGGICSTLVLTTTIPLLALCNLPNQKLTALGVGHYAGCSSGSLCIGDHSGSSSLGIIATIAQENLVLATKAGKLMCRHPKLNGCLSSKPPWQPRQSWLCPSQFQRPSHLVQLQHVRRPQRQRFFDNQSDMFKCLHSLRVTRKKSARLWMGGTSFARRQQLPQQLSQQPHPQ